MSVMLLGVAVLITAAVLAVVHSQGRQPSRPRTPVLDPRADQELRTRYLNGQIGIDVYLDRRFGGAVDSAGGHRRAG